MTNYHCERYQQPLFVTSWVSSSSTLGSAASGDRWSFWNECQVCMRLPKMIQPACFQLLETAWPTTVRLPQVAAVRFRLIAQLVQSASYVTIWLIGGTIPARSRFDHRSFGHHPEFFHHVGRIASLLRSAAPYAKIAVMVDSDPSMDAKTVDTVSNLFPCDPPGAPAKRTRLFWLSWQPPARRRAQVWARSQMPAFTECIPVERQPRVPQYPAAALRHWEEDQYKFPPKVLRWEQGLARSSLWRYPSAEERELLLGFRRRHTAAIFGKQRLLAAANDFEKAQLSVLGRAHMLVSWPS